MNILGLSFYYHDSSAALVKDGDNHLTVVTRGWSSLERHEGKDIQIPVGVVPYLLSRSAFVHFGICRVDELLRNKNVRVFGLDQIGFIDCAFHA